MQVPFITEILYAEFVAHDGTKITPVPDGYSTEGILKYKLNEKYYDKSWTLRFKTNIPTSKIVGNISFLYNNTPITYRMADAGFSPNNEIGWGSVVMSSGTGFWSGYIASSSSPQSGLYTVVDEEKELFSFIIL